jgi:arylsulfatase A-like enzyme
MRIFIRFLVFVTTLGLGYKVSADICKGCNVILISVDTLAAGHLGVYGSKVPTSPNIDRFAKSSRVYKNAYSTASWTLPAHGSMLTGYSPIPLQLLSAADRLPDKCPTLAALLKAQGYETKAITGGDFVGKGYGFSQGFESFNVSRWIDESSNELTEWLKGKHKKPFFLFLHTYAVHEPYQPSSESLNALDPHHQRKVDAIKSSRLYGTQRGKLQLQPREHEDLRLLYDASILDLDRGLTRLLETIHGVGLDYNTIVILTGDHGQELGEHGCWGCHGSTVYEEVVRVPIIWHQPGETGKELISPVSLTSIVPTVLRTLGLPPSPGLQELPLPESDSPSSQNLAIMATSPPMLLNEDEDDFGRYDNISKNQDMHRPGKPPGFHPFLEVLQTMFSIRVGKYKLIVDHRDSGVQLFDLEADPGEQTNVARKFPLVVLDLETRLFTGKPW